MPGSRGSAAAAEPRAWLWARSSTAIQVGDEKAGPEPLSQAIGADEKLAHEPTNRRTSAPREATRGNAAQSYGLTAALRSVTM